MSQPGACAFADEVEETIDEEDDEPKALNDKQKERLEKLLKHKAKLEARKMPASGVPRRPSDGPHPHRRRTARSSRRRARRVSQS